MTNYHPKTVSMDRIPPETVEILSFHGITRADVLSQCTAFQGNMSYSAAWRDLSAKAFESREQFDPSAPCRLLVIIGPGEDAKIKIDSAVKHLTIPDAGAVPDVFYGENALAGRLAFLFPGQGSQYLDMGKDLFQAFSDGTAIIGDAQKYFQSEKSLLEFIYTAGPVEKEIKRELESALRQTDVAQPAIGVISLMMVRILARFGIFPEATGGHSFGELCALFAGGRITAEDLLYLSVWRGRFMAAAGGGDKGSMLAIKAPLEQIEGMVMNHGIDLILANRNSPDQGVLSGPTSAVEQMLEICRSNRIRAMKLPVAAAFHSRLVEDAALPFQEKLEDIVFSPSPVPVYANKTAMPYPGNARAAQRLLGEHLLNPVNFVEEVRNMHNYGVRTFIEVGPKNVLTGLVGSILKNMPHEAYSMDGSSGKKSGLHDLAITLCRLASSGYPLNLSKWKNWGE